MQNGKKNQPTNGHVVSRATLRAKKPLLKIGYDADDELFAAYSSFYFGDNNTTRVGSQTIEFVPTKPDDSAVDGWITCSEPRTKAFWNVLGSIAASMLPSLLNTVTGVVTNLVKGAAPEDHEVVFLEEDTLCGTYVKHYRTSMKISAISLADLATWAPPANSYLLVSKGFCAGYALPDNTIEIPTIWDLVIEQVAIINSKPHDVDQPQSRNGCIRIGLPKHDPLWATASQFAAVDANGHARYMTMMRSVAVEYVYDDESCDVKFTTKKSNAGVDKTGVTDLYSATLKVIDRASQDAFSAGKGLDVNDPNVIRFLGGQGSRDDTYNKPRSLRVRGEPVYNDNDAGFATLY